MLKLSKAKFEKAAEYIVTKGRKLEIALFNYYFRNASLEEVLTELEKYQNKDGGFGNCIESDVRLEVSNSFSSSVAFQILCDLNVCSSNSLVKGGIKYLVQNYKPDFRGWLFFPPEVDEVPRAIWWNYDANINNKYNCNPSAEIAGYLARYPELAPEHLVVEAVNAAMEYLESNIETLNMHDIFCYQRLAKELPDNKRLMVLEKLKKRVPAVIEFDPEKWTGYAARPLSFIHSPSDCLSGIVDNSYLAKNLDYLIKEQTADGCWAPRWNWCRFDEEWKIAEQEWKGHITLENLRILNSFDRMEE
jgi:hypothetical protein